MKLFCANYVDHFGKILTKDKETDEENSSGLRRSVLKDVRERERKLIIIFWLGFCWF